MGTFWQHKVEHVYSCLRYETHLVDEGLWTEEHFRQLITFHSVIVVVAVRELVELGLPVQRAPDSPIKR